jgi:transcriptional regulator with XRE-family HTH domain
MGDSIARSSANGHANAIDHGSDDRSTTVDLAEMRTWISRALDVTGWNQEALAAHMGKDKAHISRVLSGEKPMSLAFLGALPDDVEAVVVGYYAESFGLVVVSPSHGDDAVRQLVSGLIGMLRPQLPRRASSMVKASVNGNGRARRPA